MLAGLDDLAVRENRAELGQTLERGVGAHALVLREQNVLVARFLRFPVDHGLGGRQRNNLVIEPARLVGGRGAQLARQREFVLHVAGDAVFPGHDFRRLDHGHVHVRPVGDDRFRARAMRVLVLVLGQADRFDAACHHDIHAVDHDLLCCRRHSDDPGRAHPVDRHARNGFRHARRGGSQTADIVALGALLGRAAHHHVLDLAGFHTGPLDRVACGMAGKGRRLGVVERAPERLCDGRAGDGNDDGFAQGAAPDAFK